MFSAPENDWKLVQRRRPNPAAPSQLQLHDQERQRALARRSAAKLVAKRSTKLQARQLQEGHLTQRQLKNLHRRSASAANTKARRMKLLDNVRAVVIKEVQLRDPVTQSLRVCCTANALLLAAPAPAPAPVALPSTAHCPASGDHPPTSTRPPTTRTAIRAARRSSAKGL